MARGLSPRTVQGNALGGCGGCGGYAGARGQCFVAFNVKRGQCFVAFNVRTSNAPFPGKKS
jgi:hypothetical protein